MFAILIPINLGISQFSKKTSVMEKELVQKESFDPA
jgi:hypothetical protein